MRHLALIGFCALLTACTSDVPTETPEEKEEPEIVDKKDLVVIEGNLFTEFYPGKVKIKFQGTQDENALRHGKWSFYNEKGMEMSTTMYEHGKKHGHSIVKYDNGGVFYMGEYRNDIKVGVWKTFKPNGDLDTEKDFGNLE